MKIAWCPSYVLPLPPGHRFPMAKYEWIPEQLIYEGIINPNQIHRPQNIDPEILTWTHCTHYIHKLNNNLQSKAEIRRMGFPWSQHLVHREEIIAQGTIDMALHALSNGIGLNVAGGTHHAFKDQAEGFCIYNDIAVAANYLLHHQLAKKILVLDLDVHQGNGTASIFEKESRVFTMSMHGGKNFPFHKEKSDLDLPLSDGCDGVTYMEILSSHLPQVIQNFQPDFVFYQSGVDVLSTDKLGKLNLSLKDCKIRDEYVLNTFYELNIPLVAVMGGGYSEDLKIIVEAHVELYRLSSFLYT